MKIKYDTNNGTDRAFCEWLTRHEQVTPLYFEHRRGAPISDAVAGIAIKTSPDGRFPHSPGLL